MNNKEITLFRFLSLHKPDAITEENKNAFFIYHPDEDAGDLYTDDKVEFISLLEDFTPATLQSLKNLNPGLYKFGLDILKEMHRLTYERYEEIKQQHAPTPLDSDSNLSNQILIWDHYIYYLCTQTNINTLDVCTTLLLANYWLKEIPEPPALPEELDSDIYTYRFNRQISAKIVQPFFLKFEQSLITAISEPEEEEEEEEEEVIGYQTSSELIKLMKAADSQSKLNALEKLEIELDNAEKKYNKEEIIHREQYDQEYQELLDEYMEQFEGDFFEVSEDNTNSVPPIPQGEIYAKMANPVIPKPNYNYNPINALDPERLATNLSPGSMNVLTSLREEQMTSFYEIRNSISKGKAAFTGHTLDPITPERNLTSYGGVVIDKNPVVTADVNTVAIETKLKDFATYKWYFIISIQLPAAKDLVIGGKCTVYLDNVLKDSQTLTSYPVKNDKGAFAMIFFEEGMAFSNPETGEIHLDILIYTDFSQPLALKRVVKLSDNHLTFEKKKDKSKDPETFPPDNPNPEDVNIFFKPNTYGITRLGIGEYMKVVENICCYVPGEVSHIENVMAREYKERNTRMLRRSELTDIQETSYEYEQMTDTVSTQRNEMSMEISMMEHQGRSVSVGASVSFNKIAFSGNMSSAMVFNNSKELSRNLASNDSKELTQQATERIVSRKRQERIQKIIDEYVEENKHGVDNKEGTSHISGVYRWVDKVYKCQLVNYGKRLMYEFMIPEPAQLHRLYLNKKDENQLVKPEDPRNNNIFKNYKSITAENFQFWAAAYNAEVDPAPPTTVLIGKSYSITNQHGQSEAYSFNDLEIPEGYAVNSMSYTTSIQYHGAEHNSTNKASAKVSIGNYTSAAITTSSTNSKVSVPAAGNEFSNGTIPVSISTYDTGGFALNVAANCQRTPRKFEEWQQATFSAIITAYEKKLAEFEEKTKAVKEQAEQQKKTNPLFYRDIEQDILRKNCIAYLYEKMDEEDSFKFAVGKSMQEHKVLRDKQFESYASVAKFLEQAFEWEIMGYIFYPFYWGNKENWYTLYNNDFDDELFRKFLQSGMARVVVSVRPGFEDAVNWYMNTGQVWNGQSPPVVGDDLYLSLVDELADQRPAVIDEWEVKIPSTLTVIQADGVALNSGGLPCFCEHPSDESFEPS